MFRYYPNGYDLCGLPISIMDNITGHRPDNDSVTAHTSAVRAIFASDEYKTADAIYVYFTPIIIVAGLIGNTLSFLVMTRPRNRRNSTSVYMSGLAVIDNLQILALASHWIVKCLMPDTLTDSFCKVFAYMVGTFGECSIWIVVAMTMDRFTAVWYPLRAHAWCTATRAKRVLAILCPVLAVRAIHVYFVGYLAIDIVTGTKMDCSVYDPTQTYNIYVSLICPWVDTILESIAPFILLIIFNALIIKAVQKHQVQQKELGSCMRTSTSSGPGLGSSLSISSTGMLAHNRAAKRIRKFFSKNSQDGQLTRMLLSVSFTLLLLTLPLNIIIMVNAFMSHIELEPATFYLIYSIANRLWFTNNAVNFYLYIFGGQKFRKDLIRLLTCKPVIQDHIRGLFHRDVHSDGFVTVHNSDLERELAMTRRRLQLSCGSQQNSFGCITPSPIQRHITASNGHLLCNAESPIHSDHSDDIINARF
ncbi:unnamed protein product [Owenia fusiformis]|uniref:G-protein coupled receptors family 1 profile domain-containing protein n=1 Tax=Owenia fusiformis TaxID=6347 RepID=A0A8S4PHA0_OWEFU|nr:unnamed protein product [Owenia fusiformis]